MRCPKCKLDGFKDFCMHCGYMSNGNFIDIQNNEKEVTLLEKYLGNDYDIILENRNWYIVGLFGPNYLFCHGLYFIGLIFIIIDLLVFWFFLFFDSLIIVKFIYLIMNRFFWIITGNVIYRRSLLRKFNKIIKKDKLAFQDNLKKLYFFDYRFIQLKYVCFSLTFYTIYYYVASLIKYYIWIGYV